MYIYLYIDCEQIVVYLSVSCTQEEQSWSSWGPSKTSVNTTKPCRWMDSAACCWQCCLEPVSQRRRREGFWEEEEETAAVATERCKKQGCVVWRWGVRAAVEVKGRESTREAGDKREEKGKRCRRRREERLALARLFGPESARMVGEDN